MDLSIIIVNWNTKELVINLIKSVQRTIKNLSKEIILVDNGSTDGSVEEVRAFFPSVNVIENHENLGFARANNQALKISSGKYALLLNSDTILLNGVVEELYRFMEENRDVGIAGVQLINPDGTKQHSFANEPTLLTETFNKSLLRIIFPNRFPSKRRKYNGPLEVESVIGACMMVRKEALEEVGLLDEDYFFFLEETDWCFRMRKRGWRVFHLPDLKVIHIQGQSAGILHAQARIEFFRSRYIFFRKHRPKWQYPVLLIGLIIKLFINLVFLTLVNLFTLFGVKKNRVRWNTCLKIILWHILLMPDAQGLKGCMPNLWKQHHERDGTRWVVSRKGFSFLKEIMKEIDGIAEREDFEVLNRSMVRWAGTLEIKTAEGTERVFVKKFRYKDPFNAIRFFIFGSNARKEWSIARRLLKLRIPTFRPLAFGERRKGPFIKESFLIAEEIKEAISLARYLERLKVEKDALFASIFYKILNELASIIGNMHMKGVYHRDLHAGNILISDNEKYGSSLYIIDLHRAKIIKRISRKRKLFNIAQLFLSLYEMMGKEEKREFLNRYSEIQNDPLWKREDIIGKIDLLMERIRFRHYKSREKRCLKRSTLFERERENGYDWYLRRGSPVENMKAIIESINSGVGRPYRVLKSSRERMITLWPLNVSGIAGKICVKTYRYRGLIGSLKYIFRPSRAMRAWISAHGFRVRGIQTADAIALAEKRRLGRMMESFLFMEDLSDFAGIDSYIKNIFSKKGDIKGRKRGFIETFANTIRSIHDRGVYHRDLKASNILVKEIGDEKWLFSFIDLDGVRFYSRPIGDSKRIFNLAQINESIPSVISSTDRLRFLLFYLGEKGLSQSSRALARKVIIKTRQRRGNWPYGRPNPLR